MVAGFVRAADSFCIDCNGLIDVCGERNYIVYDWDDKVYRRQCAKCHDGEMKARKTVTPHGDYDPVPVNHGTDKDYQ